MSAIVCAIRGGPGSRPTIARAIELAKETDLPLYFLYVVNLDFMEHASSGRVHTMAREMRQMGEFILLAAQSQAAKEGIQAEIVVRQGDVSEEIAKLLCEVNADYLVIGQPKSESEESLFAGDQHAQFCQRLEEATGAKIIISETD